MKPTPFYPATGNENQFRTTFPLSYWCLLLAALLFASCKKDTVAPPPPDPSYHLDVSAATVQAPAAAGSSSDITISANASWKITLPAGVDWVDVSKAAGTGNDVIQVRTTKENTSGTRRTATLTVALDNGKAPARPITVEQDFSASSPLTLSWQNVLGGQW